MGVWQKASSEMGRSRARPKIDTLIYYPYLFTRYSHSLGLCLFQFKSLESSASSDSPRCFPWDSIAFCRFWAFKARSSACCANTCSSGEIWYVPARTHDLSKYMGSALSLVSPSAIMRLVGSHLTCAWVSLIDSRMMKISILVLLSSTAVGDDGVMTEKPNDRKVTCSQLQKLKVFWQAATCTHEH